MPSDELSTIVDSIIENINCLTTEYLEANYGSQFGYDIKGEGLPNSPSFAEIDPDGDRINEIIYSAVPIYNGEIADIWYHHRDELIAAHENARAGGDSQDNDGRTAIYYLLQGKTPEAFAEAIDDFVDEWYTEELALC